MKSDKEIIGITDVSLRSAAKIGGFALLIISILAPVGYYGLIQNQIVYGDAATTVSNIIASEGVFRIGIFCLLINAVLDLVVAWALYIVLKPVNKSISLLSAWFRVAYTVMLVVALSHLGNILQLLSGAGYLVTFEPNQLHAKVMLFFGSYENVWNLGYVLFGFHLIILGYLVFKSGYFPKFLGILIKIAGLGYLIDAFGTVLFPNYNLNIAIYTFIGEPLLLIWLLMRGFKEFGEKPEESS
jgi:uncharacterized protein DUF4386